MGARAVPLPLAYLPNALTIARFVLVPLFVVLLLQGDDGHSWPAAIVFGAAGVTDQLDGWIARRYRIESEFGKYADPLADRLMIDIAVVILWLEGRLPWPALVLVVARDALLIAGARLAVPRGYEFSVSFLGKLATWILYLAVFLILATTSGTEWPPVVFWAGLGLALAAGASYGVAVWRTMRR